MKDPQDILLRPVVSEKTYALAREGRYTFEVASDANKVEIRAAIERQFQVKVKSVNTLWVRGKQRRLGRLPMGHTRRWKKAVVSLAPGDTIDIFEAG